MRLMWDILKFEHLGIYAIQTYVLTTFMDKTPTSVDKLF